MAEAFAEDEGVIFPDYPRKPISVLILATKWTFDTYGLSTIIKSLVNNLRLIDPEGKSIKITCTVLEEEDKIVDSVRRDAEEYGVKLKGAKKPRGQKGRSPNIEWLDEYTRAYYHHLMEEGGYDFIIGHIPYLTNGCFNLLDMCKEKGEQCPKIILMVHALPRNGGGEVDEDLLLDWLSEADEVFSVGHAMEKEIMSHIRGLDDDKRPVHKLYIPGYPLELFTVRPEVTGNKVQGTQNVTIFTEELKNFHVVQALNFPLAVTSTAEASKHIRDIDGVRTNLVLLSSQREYTELWRESFRKTLEDAQLQHTGLEFQCFNPENIEKLKTHFRKSNLFILPFKPESSLFGTEALAAIAAGVPVLVSRYSGISSLLKKMVEDEPVVITMRSESEIQTWKGRIIQKILNPEEAQCQARRLREQLLLDTSIASTHLDFINTIACMSSVFLVLSTLLDNSILFRCRYSIFMLT